MVQPLAALLAFVFLAAAPPPAEATSPPTADRSPAPATAGVAVAEAAPSLPSVPASSVAVAPALPSGGALDSTAPTDEGGCLLHSAPVRAPSPPDLRRPRLVAAAVPETPHPAAPGRADLEEHSPLPDLHLVRSTQDRGS